MDDLRTEAYFDSRPANEWMSEARIGRTDTLFGELWMTGELCVMFGEPGIGKSLLAVQIADSITKGKPIAPFGLSAKSKKVLYVDLEKTAEQFKRRYSARGDGENTRRKRYKFSKHFHRAVPAEGSEVPLSQLERMVEKGGTKIVIIDNLQHLVTGGQPRQAGRVMRELRRLRNAYGLSILVVTQTSRSTSRRGIAAADMVWSQTVTALADNIFAVGKGGSPSGRYIKHIKTKLAPMIFGATTVPRFEIDDSRANFPSFIHSGFGAEIEMHQDEDDRWELDTISEIRRLHEVKEYSVREIAATLEIPKSTVHRYLQIIRAMTDAARTSEHFGLDACVVDRCDFCQVCWGRRGAIDPDMIREKGHEGVCEDDCADCGPLVYDDGDTHEDPEIRRASKEFHEKLRDWVLSDKIGPRPVYVPPVFDEDEGIGNEIIRACLTKGKIL
ncbi:MAG: AAA family ATPase [Pyrinomonadaceae bacterium]